MDAPINPAGYPPPTLVRKRSGLRRVRIVILLLITALILLVYALSRFVADGSAAPAPVAPVQVEATGEGDAGTAIEPPMTVDAPIDSATPVQPTPDARRPNRWYYVDVLGDGPGAIYSRTGGQWNFAFACTARTRVIEFIAVGTGTPGNFDRQSVSVGKVKLMMDASYSADGGGTMITALPAAHPFFNALDGKAPLEVQLHAGRKTIVPVGPDVIRLVRACRGRA